MPDTNDTSRSLTGTALSLAAFFIWGLSPLYWKLLSHVPAFEIIMHRMIWSFLFLVPFIVAGRKTSEFKSALTTRKTFLTLLVTTIIVSSNWFVFIWAINHDLILQASMGYYINPLVNVLLGVVFLKERLKPMQIASVILAAAGVLYMTSHVGEFPWISIYLAVSFALYGLIRKTAPVGALTGLAVETLLLSLPALAYLALLHTNGGGAFLTSGLHTSLLLAGTALITALPLLLFTLGARRITLSTIGFLQYIAPSCSFLLAVFVYGEPLSHSQLTSFMLIWAALAIYSADSILHFRRERKRDELTEAGN